MGDPRTALSVQKMFPGSYGYRVATPRTPIPAKPAKPSTQYRVWVNYQALVEYLGGTSEFAPPDTVLTDDQRYPGGSNGPNNYLLVVSDASPPRPYVDIFDSRFATQRDRWAIPDWYYDTADGALYLAGLSYDIQHVCADGARVVVIADLYDNTDTDPNTSFDKHYIGVAVFDTSGSLLDQWLVYTSDGGGNENTIAGTNSGSCTDGAFVYFWHNTPSDIEVAAVELSSGTLTSLFTSSDVIGQLSGSNSVEASGLVVLPGGDLILVGNSTVRVQQDGTVIWEARDPNPTQYEGLAHSGRNSVWASETNPSLVAHEYSYSGVLLSTSGWFEVLSHTWLSRR